MKLVQIGGRILAAILGLAVGLALTPLFIPLDLSRMSMAVGLTWMVLVFFGMLAFAMGPLVLGMQALNRLHEKGQVNLDDGRTHGVFVFICLFIGLIGTLAVMTAGYFPQAPDLARVLYVAHIGLIIASLIWYLLAYLVKPRGLSGRLPSKLVI